MAVHSQLSRITRSLELPLDAGVALTDDGGLLVKVPGGGNKPSTGAAGEIISGFAFIRTSAAPFSPTTWVKVETFDVGVSNVVTLSRTAVVGTVSAYDNTGNAVQALGALAGTSLTLTAAAGKNVTVTYRYALTALESRMKVGDAMPGQNAGNILGSSGVAKEGVIYTNMFDSAINYRAAGELTAGANGMVTVGGAGSALNGHVVALPTEDYPYLGITFSFA